MATGGQVRKGAAAPEHCTRVAAPPHPQTSALDAQCFTERLSCVYSIGGLLRLPPIGTWDVGHVMGKVLPRHFVVHVPFQRG